MPIPTHSKDLPEIPEDIVIKAYDVCKFFRERGHNVWAYHHLCSRDFVNSEVARVTKEHAEARIRAEANEQRALSKLRNIWLELDPIFNSED